jgi:hypothetical protein
LNGEYRLRKIWIKKRRLFPFRHTGQFSDRYDQKQAIEAELQAIEAVPPLTGNDLSLLGELPMPSACSTVPPPTAGDHRRIDGRPSPITTPAPRPAAKCLT